MATPCLLQDEPHQRLTDYTQAENIFSSLFMFSKLVCTSLPGAPPNFQLSTQIAFSMIVWNV